MSSTTDRPVTPAHDQATTNRYVIHYPDHEPRETDPHYRDFNALRRRLKADPATWVCSVGAARADFTECSLDKPLELHHSHVEFSLANAVDLRWLAGVYPGIDTPDEVGAWIESADNLVVLCVRHHRGHGGIHHAAAADYEAERFVRGLIS